MNQSFSESNSSSRKNQLRRQIVEAFQLNLMKDVSLLKGLWVHRYGLDSFPFQDLQHKATYKFDPGRISPIKEAVEKDNVDKISGLLSAKPVSKGQNVLHKESFIEDIVDSSSQSILKDSDKDSSSMFSPRSKYTSPPPRRIRQNLRRWLPEQFDHISKAS